VIRHAYPTLAMNRFLNREQFCGAKASEREMDMRLLRCGILAIAFALVMGVLSPAAKAASIEIDSASYSYSGGIYTYTYNVGIGPGNSFVSGDYLNIIDFGTAFSPTWTFAGLGSPVNFSGVTAPTITNTNMPTDNGNEPSVLNTTTPDLTVTFANMTPAVNTFAPGGVPAEAPLGVLTAESLSSPGLYFFGSLDQNPANDLNGGETIVAGGDIPLTPLPASAVGGGALLGLLAISKKFVSRKVSAA
jgi:hypothetical protein